MDPKMTMKQQFFVAHHNFRRDLSLHAFFRVNDREIGEDLVQDTFMKTWNYINNGGKIQMIRAFLYHILNNLIIDEYRKRKHKANSLDLLLENGYEPVTEEHAHLIDRLDGNTTAKLISELPPKYQSVLRMHYIEHLSLDEMSSRTKQSKNTMAVQFHRGLKKLKILYENPKKIKIHKGAICHDALSDPSLAISSGP